MKQLFEFECQSCGEKFEGMIEWEEIKEIEDYQPCKYCNGYLKRVWGVGQVLFNASGFTKKST